MAQMIGTGVRLYGFNMEDWIFTFHASDDIVTAWNNWRRGVAGSFNPVGRAVTYDFGTKAGQVKLSGDDEHVSGRIESVEVREQENLAVVAVALKFLQKMEKTDDAIGAGESITGGGNGLVKQGAKQIEANIVPEAAPQGTTEVVVIRT